MRMRCPSHGMWCGHMPTLQLLYTLRPNGHLEVPLPLLTSCEAPCSMKLSTIMDWWDVWKLHISTDWKMTLEWPWVNNISQDRPRWSCFLLFWQCFWSKLKKLKRPSCVKFSVEYFEKKISAYWPKMKKKVQGIGRFVYFQKLWPGDKVRENKSDTRSSG